MLTVSGGLRSAPGPCWGTSVFQIVPRPPDPLTLAPHFLNSKYATGRVRRGLGVVHTELGCIGFNFGGGCFGIKTARAEAGWGS